MPSTATITAFYTFSADTKARAAQLNENFSNFRGHRVPINTDTITSSDMTHDLGSADHYWRASYLGSVDIGVSATASNALAWSSTGVQFGRSGTPAFRANGTAFYGVNATPFGVATLTAALHGLAACAALNQTTAATATVSEVAGSTITITTFGRPVQLIVGPAGDTSGAAAWDVHRDYTNTTISDYHEFVLTLKRNGSTLSSFASSTQTHASRVSFGASGIGLSPGCMKYLDPVAAGTYIYSLATARNEALQTITAANLKLYAYEV